MKVDVVALVLDLHQAGEQLVAVDLHPLLQPHQHAVVGLRGTEAVDAGDGGDDQHVAPGEKGAGGAVAQLVDLLVDRGVLLDEGVGDRDVGLGLVVVVVGDEVLDGVVGKELLELAVELGGQGLVVGEHQGGALHRGHHVGHGEGLAAAGDPEQDLVGVAALDACGQLGDGLGLVAAGLVVGFEFEPCHLVPKRAGATHASPHHCTATEL